MVMGVARSLFSDAARVCNEKAADAILKLLIKSPATTKEDGERDMDWEKYSLAPYTYQYLKR